MCCWTYAAIARAMDLRTKKSAPIAKRYDPDGDTIFSPNYIEQAVEDEERLEAARAEERFEAERQWAVSFAEDWYRQHEANNAVGNDDTPPEEEEQWTPFQSYDDIWRDAEATRGGLRKRGKRTRTEANMV